MREYAKVSPRLWTGRVGRELRGDLAATLLAHYFLTSPHSNAIALYWLPKSYMSADLGLPSKDLDKALAKVLRSGFARYDEGSERVWVVQHARHEWPEGLKPTDNRVKMVEAILVDHANSSLVNEFREMYSKHLSISPISPASPFEAPSKPLRSQEQEQEQYQEQQQDTACPARSANAETSETPADVVAWIPIKGKVSKLRTSLGPIRETASGHEAGVLASRLPRWRERYPGVDVEQQLRKLVGWNEASPGRRKTPTGIAKHVESWLAREQDKAGSPGNERGRNGAGPRHLGGSRHVVPSEMSEEQRRLTEEAQRKIDSGEWRLE